MWFPYALFFALITSLTSYLIAKRVMRELDEYMYLAVGNLFAIPFLFIIVIFFYQIPSIDIIFLKSIGISIVLGSIAAILAFRAIRISEVSLVSPISAFNPIFTAIISFFVLGEKFGFKGFLGILLICGGTYFLGISKDSENFLKPVINLIKHKGVQLSFIAFFLWAITPIFEKTAILHTTPQVPPFISLIGLSFSALIYVLIATVRSRNQISKVKKYIPLFLLGGFLGSLGQASAMIAFSTGNLGFVTAVFKLSMIFTIIIGWIFFKENIKARLLGGIIMLAGVFLLVI